jgi:hypothetical protein
MHTKPAMMDFEAVATSKTCVLVKIDSDLDITDSNLKILGPARNTLVSVSLSSHEIEICLPTGAPMFAELITPYGTSVNYVMGSGSDSYINN